MTDSDLSLARVLSDRDYPHGLESATLARLLGSAVAEVLHLRAELAELAEPAAAWNDLLSGLVARAPSAGPGTPVQTSPETPPGSPAG